MSTSPRVICRLATPEDKAGVLGIGDVFDGMDYLSHMYDYYIKHHKYYNYVLEVDGKIVTYFYYFVTDNGKYLIRGGARNHPKYTGQNYLKKLKKFAYSHINKLYNIPLDRRVQLHLWDDFNKKQFRENPSIDGKSRLISVLYSIRKTTTRTELTTLYGSEKFTNICDMYGGLDGITQLNREDSLTFLMNKRNQSRLFPDRIMLVGRHPFNITAENLQYAANTTTIFSSMRQDGICEAVCFVEYVKVQYGARFEICYYGESALLPTYAMKAAEYISQYDNPDSNILIVFEFPKYIPHMGVVRLMDQLGWKDKIDNNAQSIAERAVTMVPLDFSQAKI